MRVPDVPHIVHPSTSISHKEMCRSLEELKNENNVRRFFETRGMMTTLAEEGREETLSFSKHIIV